MQRFADPFWNRLAAFAGKAASDLHDSLSVSVFDEALVLLDDILERAGGA